MELKPFYPIFSYEPGSYRDRLQLMMMKKLEKSLLSISPNLLEMAMNKLSRVPKVTTLISGLLFIVSLFALALIHVVAFFFNDINLLYGAVQENCTNFSCPHMTAGTK